MKKNLRNLTVIAVMFMLVFSSLCTGILAADSSGEVFGMKGVKDAYEKLEKTKKSYENGKNSPFTKKDRQLKAEETTTAIIECGKGHEEFAKKFYTKNKDLDEFVKYSGSRVYLTFKSAQVAKGSVFFGIEGMLPSQEDNGARLNEMAVCGPKPLTSYSGAFDIMQEVNSTANQYITDNQVFYMFWEVPVKTGTVTLTPPKCGTNIETVKYEGDSYSGTRQEPLPSLAFSGNVTGYSKINLPIPKEAQMDGLFITGIPEEAGPTARPEIFSGTVKGGDKMYLYTIIVAKAGYYFTEDNAKNVTIKGMKLEVMDTSTLSTSGALSAVLAYASFTVPHDLDAGKVTKEATLTSTGTRVRTCKVCGEKVTETIPKLTAAQALEKGAGEKDADKVITSMKNDNDPKGSKYAPIMLKSTKQTKKSVTLTWKKVSGAKKYVIYGNKCGKKNRMKKLTTVKKNSAVMKKVLKKKVKKATYYKFIVVAVDKKGKVVSTSKVVHAATKGGKVGNNKGISVKKKVVTKAKKLKAGKSLKIGAKATKAKKVKVKNHVKVRYESSNTKIATVSKKGVIKAKKKGKCKVYVYAQNGIAKTLKVVVK